MANMTTMHIIVKTKNKEIINKFIEFVKEQKKDRLAFGIAIDFEKEITGEHFLVIRTESKHRMVVPSFLELTGVKVEDETEIFVTSEEPSEELFEYAYSQIEEDEEGQLRLEMVEDEAMEVENFKELLEYSEFSLPISLKEALGVYEHMYTVAWRRENSFGVLDVKENLEEAIDVILKDLEKYDNSKRTKENIKEYVRDNMSFEATDCDYLIERFEKN